MRSHFARDMDRALGATLSIGAAALLVLSLPACVNIGTPLGFGMIGAAIALRFLSAILGILSAIEEKLPEPPQLDVKPKKS